MLPFGSWDDDGSMVMRGGRPARAYVAERLALAGIAVTPEQVATIVEVAERHGAIVGADQPPCFDPVVKVCDLLVRGAHARALESFTLDAPERG